MYKKIAATLGMPMSMVFFALLYAKYALVSLLGVSPFHRQLSRQFKKLAAKAATEKDEEKREAQVTKANNARSRAASLRRLAVDNPCEALASDTPV
jgi:hypothetical protein